MISELVELSPGTIAEFRQQCDITWDRPAVPEFDVRCNNVAQYYARVHLQTMDNSECLNEYVYICKPCVEEYLTCEEPCEVCGEVFVVYRKIGI